MKVETCITFYYDYEWLILLLVLLTTSQWKSAETSSRIVLKETFKRWKKTLFEKKINPNKKLIFTVNNWSKLKLNIVTIDSDRHY